ncbi:MAG: hypothetical protein ACYDB9_09640 [Gammaproteobacteria bacterium]
MEDDAKHAIDDARAGRKPHARRAKTDEESAIIYARVSVDVRARLDRQAAAHGLTLGDYLAQVAGRPERPSSPTVVALQPVVQCTTWCNEAKRALTLPSPNAPLALEHLQRLQAALASVLLAAKPQHDAEIEASARHDVWSG